MYYFFVLGRRLALILPRNVAYLIANIFSVLYFYIHRKDRRALAYNLSLIVEDKKAIKRHIKEIFMNFSYYLVDFFRYEKLSPAFIKKYIRINGLERVNECLEKGKGAIALTAHLGNYELAAAVTAMLGYPLSVVALPHKDGRVNDFFNHQRQSAGMKVIPTGSAIKGCLSALKRNEIVALLGDKNFSKKGRKTKVFSKYANIPLGAPFFALKTGACIIPSFLVRENKYFYHLIFEEPIYCPQDNIDAEAFMLEKYLFSLENYLKKYPGQWYMFEKYWLES